MVTVTLQLRDSESNLAAEVTGEFDKDDVARLSAFSAHMSRVNQTSLLVRGFSGITNMKWEPGAGMNFTCAPFSNAELHELLHVLRPVMLEEERASFKKTLALLGERFKDKTFAQHSRSLRHIFEDGDLSLYMQVHVGGQKLFHNSVLRLWLNGIQYHTDHEKEQAWRRLEESLTENNARALAIELVHSRVKSLLLLDHVVQLVLSKADA